MYNSYNEQKGFYSLPKQQHKMLTYIIIISRKNLNLGDGTYIVSVYYRV